MTRILKLVLIICGLLLLTAYPAYAAGSIEIQPYFESGEGINDATGFRYHFYVAENEGRDYLKSIRGITEFKGNNSHNYLIETGVYSFGIDYSNYSCSDNQGLSRQTNPAEASLRIGLPYSIKSSLPGVKTNNPAIFPRITHETETKDQARTELVSQLNLNGKEGMIEMSKGEPVTDKSGWLCEKDLEDIDYLQWNIIASIDSEVRTMALALPKAAASSLASGALINLQAEALHSSGAFKVYYWGIEVRRSNGQWEGIDQWKVTSSDGSLTDYGARKVKYNNTTAIEISNDGSQGEFIAEGEVFSLSAPEDSAPPSGSLSINSGAQYANAKSLTLNLSAQDDTGVTGYYLSEESSTPEKDKEGWVSLSPVTAYNVDITYSLKEETGSANMLTLYVWYKDAAGNISETASDSISFDLTAPSLTITSPTTASTFNTKEASLTLSGTASDNASGIEKITYTSAQGATGTAIGATNWSIPSLKLAKGENVFTIIAYDKLNNSTQISFTVNCEVTEPPGTPVFSQKYDGKTAASDSISWSWGPSTDGGVTEEYLVHPSWLATGFTTANTTYTPNQKLRKGIYQLRLTAKNSAGTSKAADDIVIIADSDKSNNSETTSEEQSNNKSTYNYNQDANTSSEDSEKSVDSEKSTNSKESTDSENTLLRTASNATTEKETYSVSGKITDNLEETGIEEITVKIYQDSQEIDSTKTLTDGSFKITQLSKGDYTLKPSKNGYSFEPRSKAIEVEQNVIEANFRADSEVSEEGVRDEIKDKLDSLITMVVDNKDYDWDALINYNCYFSAAFKSTDKYGWNKENPLSDKERSYIFSKLKNIIKKTSFLKNATQKIETGNNSAKHKAAVIRELIYTNFMDVYRGNFPKYKTTIKDALGLNTNQDNIISKIYNNFNALFILGETTYTDSLLETKIYDILENIPSSLYESPIIISARSKDASALIEDSIIKDIGLANINTDNSLDIKTTFHELNHLIWNNIKASENQQSKQDKAYKLINRAGLNKSNYAYTEAEKQCGENSLFSGKSYYCFSLSSKLTLNNQSCLTQTDSQYCLNPDSLKCEDYSSSSCGCNSCFIFYFAAPDEFLPYLANGWRNTEELLKSAVESSNNANNEPINQFLFLADIYSEGNNLTKFYSLKENNTADTQDDTLSIQEISLTRNNSGQINSLTINNNLYAFELEDGNVTAVNTYDTTQEKPTVTTADAEDITDSSAKIKGTVNANNSSTQVWMEYGIESGAYNKNQSYSDTVGGNSLNNVSFDLTGLSSQTKYFYRIAASNAAGTQYGDEKNFTTTASISNSYTISGLVTLEGNNALEGATITCYKDASLIDNVISNNNGEYEIGKLSSGTYSVSAKKADYTFTSDPQSGEVSVGQNNTAGKINFTATAVTSDSEAPVINITSPTDAVTYSTTDNSINLSGTATDNTEVTKLRWASTATGKSGTVSGTTNWSASGIELSEGANTITITAKDAAGNTAEDIITVDYAPVANTYTISGIVKDSDGEGIESVDISFTSGSNTYSTNTNSDGEYEKSGLPAGTYTISASKTGYNFSSIEIELETDENIVFTNNSSE